MTTYAFPEFSPDLSDIETGISQLVQGCVPRKDGYGPFPQLQASTQALAGAARGVFFSRRTDGSIAVFGATATDLYLMNSALGWTKVSKGGASYSQVPATDTWKFVQFNDTVIAVQANTVPQKYVLTSSTNFADLGGSPPQASHIAVIGGFVVLTGLTSASKRIQWSDLFGPESWTAGVGLSDFQDLPDGGSVHSIAGGDYFGVVFQDDRIRRLLYTPGSAAIFDILVISTGESIIGQYSPITVSDSVYYCSSLGFRVIKFGQPPQSIGKEKVDRTFQADIDLSNLQLFQGSSDPSGTRVIWAYKSVNGKANLFDKAMVYDFALSKFTTFVLSGEMLASLARPGVTLEQLDAIAPSQITITGAADNGGGAIRLTLSGLTAGPFTLGTVNPSQPFIEVQGVTGTTEANGSWPYVIADSTHIDLVGSTFANAYVSGGAIGGSLDAMTVPFDSYSTAGTAELAAFDSLHRLGYFTGSNMEATIETGEQDSDGNMTFVTSVRPITDAAAGLVSIGYRNVAQGAVQYSGETAIDTSQGQAPCLVEARYLKVRLRIPAGSTWTYALGVQPEIQVAGEV